MAPAVLDAPAVLVGDAAGYRNRGSVCPLYTRNPPLVVALAHVVHLSALDCAGRDVREEWERGVRLPVYARVLARRTLGACDGGHTHVGATGLGPGGTRDLDGTSE